MVAGKTVKNFRGLLFCRTLYICLVYRILVFIASWVRLVTGNCHCSAHTGWSTRRPEILCTWCIETICCLLLLQSVPHLWNM